MITVSDVSLSFGGQNLFTHVNLKFTGGNCYGVIGANGAGKSTFLKILSGELEATSGQISIKPGARMSVLKQDQNQYDAYTILDTVIMGNQHLYDVMKEKDALYEKPDFSEEDGMRASELEAEFADMDGWEAESDASKLLQGLGIPVELHYDLMGNTDPRLKVKVLLAQALFGKPDIVMLDEPTNNLDPANQQEVMREVRREVDERGIAACAVMHDINLAIRYCDRFLFLKDGAVDAVGGRECVTPERIKRIYGMDADIIEHGGRPVVIPR